MIDRNVDGTYFVANPPITAPGTVVVAAMRPIFQSILFWRMYAKVADRAVKTIINRLVPTARCALRSKSSIRIGTTMTPPPTPTNAPRKPANSPSRLSRSPIMISRSNQPLFLRDAASDAI